MRVLPYGQRQERSGLDPVLSPVGHRNARYQVTRESPDPSLSLRYPHEARAQIGKSCGANGASPLGQRCTPRLLFLRRDVSEPPVELGRAVARIRAGNERLIVQFDTEKSASGSTSTVRGSLSYSRTLPTISSMGNASGPAISIVPFTGSATAASATAVATSSAAIGWNNECDRRTVSPSMAACAMPRRNSKNWVARTIVYGVGAFLMRLSCASLARK